MRVPRRYRLPRRVLPERRAEPTDDAIAVVVVGRQVEGAVMAMKKRE
jgi:hypothetical protein